MTLTPQASTSHGHFDDRTKRRAVDLARKRDELVTALKVSDSRLYEFLRRGEETAQIDGYPPASGQSSICGGRRSDPTGAQAARAAGGHGTDPDTWDLVEDPVASAISRIGANIDEAHRLLTGAGGLQRMLDYVLRDAAKDVQRGSRPSSLVNCQACAQPILGAVRRGLCHPCSSRYYRIELPRPLLSDWTATERGRKPA